MSKFTVGQKVVPVSKTLKGFGELSQSAVWKDAKDKKQPYLYIGEIRPDRIECVLNMDSTWRADFFAENDLVPYAEEYKGFKVGDTVRIYGTEYTIVEDHSGVYVVDKKGKKQSSVYDTLSHFVDRWTHAMKKVDTELTEYKGFKEGSKFKLFGCVRTIAKDADGYYFMSTEGKRTTGSSKPLKTLIDDFLKDMKPYTTSTELDALKQENKELRGKNALLRTEVEKHKTQITRLEKKLSRLEGLVEQLDDIVDEMEDEF